MKVHEQKPFPLFTLKKTDFTLNLCNWIIYFKLKKILNQTIFFIIQTLVKMREEFQMLLKHTTDSVCDTIILELKSRNLQY